MSWKFWKRWKKKSKRPRQPTHVERIEQQIEATRSIIQHKVDQIVDNMENLDELQAKADALREASYAFKKHAQKTSRLLWFKRVKIKIIIGSILFGLLAIGIASLLTGLGICTGWVALAVSLITAAVVGLVVAGTLIYEKVLMKREAQENANAGMQPEKDITAQLDATPAMMKKPLEAAPMANLISNPGRLGFFSRTAATAIPEVAEHTLRLR